MVGVATRGVRGPRHIQVLFPRGTRIANSPASIARIYLVAGPMRTTGTSHKGVGSRSLVR